jgi:chemotaxis protein MotB
VLRIDGHTDDRPISSSQFPSNWELSTARAVAVLKYLASRGIPPDRLAAAGFGEFRPIDTSGTDEGRRRNRRIEIKFDQR